MLLAGIVAQRILSNQVRRKLHIDVSPRRERRERSPLRIDQLERTDLLRFLTARGDFQLQPGMDHCDTACATGCTKEMHRLLTPRIGPQGKEESRRRQQAPPTRRRSWRRNWPCDRTRSRTRPEPRLSRSPAPHTTQQWILASASSRSSGQSETTSDRARPQPRTRSATPRRRGRMEQGVPASMKQPSTGKHSATAAISRRPERLDHIPDHQTAEHDPESIHALHSCRIA